jgi:tetratricopeptide (TPR) repeat protein
MPHDAQGNLMTAASEAHAAAYDAALASLLRFHADLMPRLTALREADLSCTMAHVLAGAVPMLAYTAKFLPAARAGLAAARISAANAREQMHVAALTAWTAGDIDGAIAGWEAILESHPRDLLALFLAHNSNFWLGRPQDMRASVERVRRHWSPAVPGFGGMLACRCFAQEECGDFLAAEPDGRRAVEEDPGNFWATHAVAHILEMQARRAEGIAWLGGLAPHWGGANNLRHHLWWHRALYHLEGGEMDMVLALYDAEFRNLASPLTIAIPDLHIDMQNAASMLARLELRGVDAGGRWEELADQAEGKIGDTFSPFTLPHAMMALAATGRSAAANRLLAATEEAAAGADPSPTRRPILAAAVLPAMRGVRAWREGRPAAAVEALRPALGALPTMGGSHAQQDVLEQIFVHCARQAGLGQDVALALERFAGRRRMPPARFSLWAEAAA